ncbi:hypothetical protein EWM64_g8447, partial [Hericium alpestre]
MTSTIDIKSIGRPAAAQRGPRRRHVRSLTGDFPEVDDEGQEKWPRGDEKTWKTAMRGLHTALPDVTKSIVGHVQTSLARAPYNLDDFGAYQAAALSVRDNLIVNWNLTQLHYTRKAPKRAYYLSLEFLMGRTLSNALLNLGVQPTYGTALTNLGF